jgi:phenylpropionate dioxygenase-like ring-hydroxylating dioxygenase large terminal subunit
VKSFPAITRGNWFALALSRNVGSRPARVLFFGAPLAVARNAEGTALVLEDRCPHRGVPLSRGRMGPEGIVCPFHGWTFDAQGRCVRMPGAADGCPVADVRVPALATMERDGIVWASQSADAPLPERVLAMDPGCRRFLWQSTWRGPIVEVLENFLDPLHTHSIHPGLVRAGTRRPVEAVLRRQGDGFRVDYTGNEEQSGFLFRLFESRRLLERAWLSGPGVAQLEYRYASGWSACISIHCSPETAATTHVFATLHVTGRWAPAWLVRLLVWPFLRKVAAQDQAMLEEQSRGLAEFPGRRPCISALDLARPYIEAAWDASPRPLPDERRVLMHL